MSAADETRRSSASSRYELLVKIASGGMATVYVGRLRSAQGFWRLVAIKRAHAHLLESPQFKRMLVDEARVASRLHHANVVSVLDVEELKGELRLVMDYIEGAALSDMAQRHDEHTLPPRLAVRIVLDVAAGLQAAHELRDEKNRPLGLVHRDVSPHNILVGVDGTARIADFGIAKAEGSGVTTTTGGLKGKLGYMAPEYVEGTQLDARSDVFSLGVVAWEALTGKRLFRGDNELETLKRIVSHVPPRISSMVPPLGDALDDVIAMALEKSPDARFASARAFATALETAASRARLVGTHADVADHVIALAGPSLEKRRAEIRERLGGEDVPGALPLLSTANLPVVELPKAAVTDGRPDDTSTLGGSGVSSRALLPEDADGVRAPARRRSRAGAIAVLAFLGVGAALLGGLAVQRATTRSAAAPDDRTSAAPAPSIASAAALRSTAPETTSAAPGAPATAEVSATPASPSNAPSARATLGSGRRNASGAPGSPRIGPNPYPTASPGPPR